MIFLNTMKACAFVLQQNLFVFFSVEVFIYLSIYLSILRLYKTLCSPTVRTLVYIRQSNTSILRIYSVQRTDNAVQWVEPVQCAYIYCTMHVYRAKYSIFCSAFYSLLVYCIDSSERELCNKLYRECYSIDVFAIKRLSI